MYDSHARRTRKPAGLLLVPMIDIFTVLVTFLLMTAVFCAHHDPASSICRALRAARSREPTFRLEVIVRKEGLELTNGTTRIATIPNVNGEYDLKTLSELAVSLKRDYPEADSASVLLEPDVGYDNLIQVMDAIRSADVPATAADVGSLASRAQVGAQTDVQMAPHRSSREWPCSRRSPLEMRHEPVPVPSRSKMKSSPAAPRRGRAQPDSADRHPVGDGGVPARVLRERGESCRTRRASQIPQSTAESQPKQSVVVMITKDQLFVQGELIATIEEIRDVDGTPLIEPLRAVLERPMLVNDGAAARMERWRRARSRCWPTSRCRTKW